MYHRFLLRVLATGLVAAMILGGCGAADSSSQTTEASREAAEESSETAAPENVDAPKPYANSTQALEEVLQQTMEQFGTDAANVVLMEDGEIIYQKSFGQADAGGAPVTSDTLFNIGSVSKVYATAAVYKLAQDGKLSPDDPVVQHLPEFRMADERYRGITVKMLLNHTSGLPGGNIDNWFLSGSDTNPDGIAILLETLQSETLKAAPGEYAVYCNEGFMLAAEVVTRVSGMPYMEYLRSHVLEPMGLTVTTNSSDPALDDSRFARCYDAEGNLIPREIGAGGLDGSGALTSTIKELALFGDRLFREDAGVFSADTIAQLREFQYETKLGEANQFNCLGWDTARYNFGGLEVYSKSGGTTQFLTQLVVAPDQGITIAGTTTMPSGINAQMETFMVDVLTEKGALTAEGSVSAPPPEAEVDAATEALAGKYSLIGGALLVDVSIEDNQLTLSPHLTTTLPGQDGSIPYRYREDGGFWSERTEKGEYEVLSLREIDGKTFVMQEIHSPVYSYTLAVAQGLKAAEADAAWTDRNGSQWLRENMLYNCMTGMGDTVAALTVPEEDPGYVLFLRGTPFRITGANTADDVAETARDSGRLVFEDGVMDYRGVRFVSADTAAPLPVDGPQEVPLQGGSKAVWYRAIAPVRLSPGDMSADVRLVVHSAEGDILYDNFVQSGPVEIPADGLILITSGTASTARFDLEQVQA